MTDQIENDKGRRTLIAGMGVAAAGLTLGASAAHAQSSSRFQPARHGLDAWLDELPGSSHRVFVDSSTALGGAEALLYSNNILSAHANAYSGSDDDYAMVICFRHVSTPFGYSDAVWEKYGEIFNQFMQFPDPSTGSAPTSNLMNATDRMDLPNFGNTIDKLGARGVSYAICDNATQFFSAQVASRTSTSVDDVYAELTGSAIANSRFVSAGVIAVTRAQEYGYSILDAG
jgi:intracellular sulfur oxidation DsrE/DsrF family protein